MASVDSSSDSNPERTGTASAELPRTRAHRRGNREGSIYQRSDGRWVACVTEPSGRRVYRYARTRAAAAAKLAAALKAVKENNPLPPERETVASYLTRWLDGSYGGLPLDSDRLELGNRVQAEERRDDMMLRGIGS